MKNVGEESLPGPVSEVLEKYRSLRSAQSKHAQRGGTTPRVRYWARKEDAGGHPWEAIAADGPGTTLLRSCLAESIGALGTSVSAPLRERLLLEAVRRGYLYLVHELLCPPRGGSDRFCPLPVSPHITDPRDNNILHLAVLSGRSSLVKWILKYSGGDGSPKELLRSLNECLDVPLSLAVRRGKMSVINAFLHSQISSVRLLPYFDLEKFPKRLGVEDLFSRLRRGETQFKSAMLEMAKVREEQTGKAEKRAASSTLAYLALLYSRSSAAIAVRDKFDVWMRPNHLNELNYLSETRFSSLINEGEIMKSLEIFKESFAGHFRPWWDSDLSNFDLGPYISNRPEEESGHFFDLLLTAIEGGQFDTAIWLLDHFKAPPSLLSFRSDDFDPDWYLRTATKLLDIVVQGWTDDRAQSMVDGKKFSATCGIVHETLGLYRSSYDYCDEARLRSIQGQYAFQTQSAEPEEGIYDIDVGKFWTGIQDCLESSDSGGFCSKQWFGVAPSNYVAVKRACALPLADFEGSDHGRLLTYFLTTVYRDDSKFSSADLPNLARFICLDHLPLFLYLVQHAFLDLDMPLLSSTDSSADEDSNAVMDDEDEEGGDQCSICLDRLDDPYTLTCGHNFHRKCLFQYAFPSLREESPEIHNDQLVHQVLSDCPHLSFTLGRATNCPYCRQAVKPSLSEAFALNLADGLKRTGKERRNRPNSPHLDIRECSPGITVGEVMLAFAACSGSIDIFQWLVRDCGIKPERIDIGGANLLYLAVSHSQAIIIRWLCQNGYSRMCYGGLDRTSEFGSYIPSSDVGLELDDDNIERIAVWEKEIDLMSLEGYQFADKYSDSEKAALQESPTESESEIIRLRKEVQKQSPLHYLLMTTFNDLQPCSLVRYTFVAYLKSKQITPVPANWHSLILSLSVDKTMRSDAKAFLSQEILSIPQGLGTDMTSRIDCNNDKTTFMDVVTSPFPEPLSLKTVTNDVNAFNFWSMLLRGEDWRAFLQVAMTLNVWHYWSTFDLFEDKPDVHETIINFVGAIIDIGRVDVLAGFVTMKEFHDSWFDLFYSGNESRIERRMHLVSNKKALRLMVQGRNKEDEFSSFFDHLDNVKEAKHELFGTKGAVLQAVSSGKLLAEIKEAINCRRDRVISLPEIDEPLGIGSHKRAMRFVDPSNWDWFDDYNQSRMEALLTVIQRGDREILRWVFSLQKDKLDECKDLDDENTLIKKVGGALAYAGKLFVLEEFVLYFSEETGPDKYRNKRGELLRDLFSHDDKAKDRDGIFGMMNRDGILGKIITYIFDTYCDDDLLGKENQGAGQIKDRIESLYAMAQWILQQPEIAVFLADGAKRAECMSCIFDNLALKYHGLEQSHEVFRLMNMLRLHQFDLKSDIDGRGVLLYVVEWGDETTSTKKMPLEVLDTLRDGEAYKDKKGNHVWTTKGIIQWLVLEVGVDIQHMRYKDLLASQRHSSREPCISESEWDALKEEQFASATLQAGVCIA